MLSNTAEDLRAGKNIYYHLTGGAALICGCSALSMIALIRIVLNDTFYVFADFEKITI
ncbi:hypothetical protein SAMN04488084_11523 [Pedobacter antarcticus]|nr:hypothetical protein SAMN04488084_11523 [Pedobacter antarcticus]